MVPVGSIAAALIDGHAAHCSSRHAQPTTSAAAARRRKLARASERDTLSRVGWSRLLMRRLHRFVARR
jgi:hypothetical protein